MIRPPSAIRLAAERDIAAEVRGGHISSGDMLRACAQRMFYRAKRAKMRGVSPRAPGGHAARNRKSARSTVSRLMARLQRQQHCAKMLCEERHDHAYGRVASRAGI